MKTLFILSKSLKIKKKRKIKNSKNCSKKLNKKIVYFIFSSS